MKTIAKAQAGKSVAKKKKPEMVESEMFPGKMIPKSQSNYESGNYAKMLSGSKKPTTAKKPVAKKPVVKKKAETGASIKPSLRSGQYKRIGRLAAKNPDRAKRVASRMVERDTRKARGKEYVSKNLGELMPKSKSGSSVKKCRYGCK